MAVPCCAGCTRRASRSTRTGASWPPACRITVCALSPTSPARSRKRGLNWPVKCDAAVRSSSGPCSFVDGHLTDDRRRPLSAIVPAVDSEPIVVVGKTMAEMHRPGTDRLWGESWYFDFASADGSVGGFVRVGDYPNLGQ